LLTRTDAERKLAAGRPGQFRPSPRLLAETEEAPRGPQLPNEGTEAGNGRRWHPLPEIPPQRHPPFGGAAGERFFSKSPRPPPESAPNRCGPAGCYVPRPKRVRFVVPWWPAKGQEGPHRKTGNKSRGRMGFPEYWTFPGMDLDGPDDSPRRKRKILAQACGVGMPERDAGKDHDFEDFYRQLKWHNM